MREILKVFKHSIVYGLTGVVSTLAAVLLVPIYTRILTPEDYGVIAILSTLVPILVLVLNLGLGSAIFWAYFRAEGENEKKKVVGTALVFQVLFTLFLTIVLLILSPTANWLLFQSAQPTAYFMIIFLTIFFQAGIAIPLAILRAREQPKIYVLLTISSLILNISFAIWLVVFLKWGVLGVLLASLISSALVYSSAIPFVIRHAKLGLSLPWLKDMLSFGLPLVPAGLAMWILNSSDRYFLNFFRDLSEVGLYNVGYRAGALLFLVVGAMNLAYAPFMFSVYKKENAKEIYKQFAKYYFLILASLALVLSVLAKEVIQLLTGPEFHSAYVVVPFIAFAYVLYGLYATFATGINVKRKTIFHPISVAIASIVNLGLNYLFIPKFGMVGAAAATLLSFVILTFVMFNFSNKFYPINFEIGKIFKVALAVLLVYFLSTQLNFGFALQVIIKSFFLMVLYPGLLFLLGVIGKGEINKVKLVIRSFKLSKLKL